MRRQWYGVSTFVVVALVSSPAIGAGSTSQGKPAQDQIEVVGHLALSAGDGGPVTRFLTTQHYGRSYLYVERAGTNAVMLVDVTKTNQPSIVENASYGSARAAGGARESLVSVAGTAALVTQESSRAISTPEPVRIMDFADPEHPKVVREFIGVTAIARDDRRGLIFLANGDGIWILRRNLAEDPAMAKAYDDYVNYYR
jgi:hypothetical protein